MKYILRLNILYNLLILIYRHISIIQAYINHIRMSMDAHNFNLICAQIAELRRYQTHIKTI